MLTDSLFFVFLRLPYQSVALMFVKQSEKNHYRDIQQIIATKFTIIQNTNIFLSYIHHITMQNECKKSKLVFTLMSMKLFDKVK